MALSTLLEIVTRAADDLGLSRPAALIGSSIPQNIQLLAAAQSAGHDLMRSHDWGALQTLGTITTADGTSSYSLASDYDRMIADTGWDRTNTTVMAGPDSVSLNRALLEGTVQVGSQKRFRLQGTSIKIYPTPTAVETLVYEYVSNKWALSNASVAQVEFLADTDTSVFDPDLMKAEVKWRFMSAKGVYADALKDEAMGIRNVRIAGDAGGSALQMGITELRQFIDLNNVPDGSW